MSFVFAGEDHYPTALDVVRDGLLRFPSEISLSAIGTDIALARSDRGMASDLINKLPDPARKLPKWRTREALLDCQAGDKARAAEWFTNAVRVSPEAAYTQNLLSEEWLSRLDSEPTPANCSAAALEMLQSR